MLLIVASWLNYDQQKGKVRKAEWCRNVLLGFYVQLPGVSHFYMTPTTPWAPTCVCCVMSWCFQWVHNHSEAGQQQTTSRLYLSHLRLLNVSHCILTTLERTSVRAGLSRSEVIKSCVIWMCWSKVSGCDFLNESAPSDRTDSKSPGWGQKKPVSFSSYHPFKCLWVNITDSLRAFIIDCASRLNQFFSQTFSLSSLAVCSPELFSPAILMLLDLFNNLHRSSNDRGVM